MSGKYISISPFIYRNYQRVCENNKKSISFGEIIKLSKDNKLHKIHLDILEHLYEYRYLTSHLIELLIGTTHVSTGKRQSISIKQAISFMVKKGMILRHYFLTTPKNTKENIEQEKECFPVDANEEDTLPDIEEIEYLNSIRSVYFYTLSRGAASYIINLKDKTIPAQEHLNKITMIQEPYKVLQTLSANQFVIINKNKPKGFELSFNMNITENINSKDKLNIHALGRKEKDNSLKSFAVFSIRNNPCWKEELSDTLQKFKLFIQQQYSEGKIQDFPLIILICETDFHIRQAFMSVSSLDPNMQILYTTDIRQINNDFNDNLLKITKDEIRGNTIYTEYVSPLLI